MNPCIDPKHFILPLEANKIHHGNAVELLRLIPRGTVDTCVTSPPYFGLRNYGTPPQVWGGDRTHEHAWDNHRYYVEGGGSGPASDAFSSAGEANAKRLKEARWRSDDTCICGAWRGSLGLEPTPKMFVHHLVQLFRGVRDALRDDGTLWVNIGDSYCSTPNSGAGWESSTLTKPNGRPRKIQMAQTGSKRGVATRKDYGDLKLKDLLGIPWMLAFALRDDGWYLRSDIIWAKKNCIPESVRDRPTRSHEYMFLLSKSPKYYYDHEAVKEPCKSGPSDMKKMREGKARLGGKTLNHVDELCAATARTKLAQKRGVGHPEGRNMRDVWHIATRGFKGAHFATFPPDLVEPCIKAGSREGGVVLDPFSGAGTTAVVAKKLGRRYIGLELNAEYVAMSERRIEAECGTLI